MERRRFISALATAPFLAWLGGAAAEVLFGATRNPPQRQRSFPGHYTPGMPQNQQPWPGPGQQFPPVQINKRQVQHEMLMQKEKNIRKDVARLYDLAGKLRKQVSDTDSSEVLSVKMIRTAEEIEKLAKHIRNLARG